MTAMDISLGLSRGPAGGLVGSVSEKAGERGNKNKAGETEGGFDAALSGKTKKPTQPPQHRDEAAASLRDLILAISAEDLPEEAVLPGDGDILPQPHEDEVVVKLTLPDDDQIDPDLQEGGEILVQPDNILPAVAQAPAPLRQEVPRNQASIIADSKSATPIPVSGAISVSDAMPTRTSPVLVNDAAAQASPSKPMLQTFESVAPNRSAGAIASTQGLEPVMTGARPADPSQPRISVLGFGTSPAPLSPIQAGPTASALLADIEIDPTWRAASEAANAASQRGQSHHSVSTLRIQLNPVELGMVNARLTITNSQLEVEIRVETSEARQRLTSDSDAIVKAMRAIGFEVDKVVIHHTPQNSSAAAQPGTQGREASLQQQGQQQADANAGGRNGQKGSADDNDRNGRAMAELTQEKSGSGVYI